MHTLVCALTWLLVAVPQATPVKSSFDGKADFASFHTYTWNKGHEANDPVVHKTIVDAVEAQMAGLGFTKVDVDKADVILKYHTLRSDEVDLKLLEKLDREGKHEIVPTKMIGTLVVALYPPRSTETLWQAHIKRPMSDDANVRTGEIKGAVTALFETYPTRKKKGGE